VRCIPVRALIDTADPAVNLTLEGGEEIRVPEAGKIFVVGNVKMPGAFPVDDASDTTVLKFIALTPGVGSLRVERGLHLSARQWDRLTERDSRRPE
jgi:hypothetical protein